MEMLLLTEIVRLSSYSLTYYDYSAENGTVPDPEVSTFLNNLTRIGGRLVINEINSQTSINFKNLKEVGKYKNGDELLPNIEIKSNVVEQITFPRIQSNECVPPGSYNPKINSEKTCIRIQNNQDPSENPLNITFENGKISNEETRDFTNDLLKMRILPPSEKIKIENEDSLEKRTEKYREFDWHSDAYDGIIELNAVFSIFIMAGMIAAPVAVFYLHKKLFDVAYVSVDMGDEKSNKDLFDDDEYFNVDDKRDSGMDDLGSI
uniref:Transmembrane protein n=2 Tax=Caenorhabditis tropicalis TaxID=1561998 RepID=A0A1I7UED2_9PELO